MDLIVRRAGDLLGVLGIVVCLAAGVGRLSGFFHLFGAEVVSVFQGGIGLMVAACLLKLWARELAGSD